MLQCCTLQISLGFINEFGVNNASMLNNTNQFRVYKMNLE
jgi:hypothetical protein